MEQAGTGLRMWRNLRMRASHWLRKQKWVVLKIVKNPSALTGTLIITLMIVCAVFAPQISPHDPYAVDLDHRFEGPSARYLLGTDVLGRDILTRIIYSARIVVPMIFSVVILGAVAGVLMGMIAGYFSGTILDKVIIWIFDVVSTFPGLILVLALVATFGSSDLVLVLIMAFWRIPGYGRIARTEILSIRNEPYIKAAEALGAKRSRIILSHMLPNSIPPIVVLAGMDLGVVVMGIAGLSYLGLGIQPPKPNWGGMLAEGYGYIRQSPWLIVWGSLTLVVIMIGCSLFSGGLRSSLKPEESLSQ